MPRTAKLAGVIAFTTCLLSFISWLNHPERFGLLNTAGILIWVASVISALTLVARTYESRWDATWKYIALLALTAGVVSALTNVLFYVILVVADYPGGLDEHPSFVSVTRALTFGFFDGDALFGFWALLVELPRRISDRRALEHEAELSRIRLTLHPHFVLNTLNTIASLVVDEPRRARDLLATLGDLLRDMLADARRPHRSRQSVSDEVRWLRGFAEILESRHLGRLQFGWHIDPSVESTTLPFLLLQPLVENAVHHGALRRPEGGMVTVTISGEEEQVVCTVHDDGPGFDPAANSARRGNGLDLVRRRVRLESDEGAVQIRSRAGDTEVKITLPRSGT